MATQKKAWYFCIRLSRCLPYLRNRMLKAHACSVTLALFAFLISNRQTFDKAEYANSLIMWSILFICAPCGDLFHRQIILVYAAKICVFRKKQKGCFTQIQTKTPAHASVFVTLSPPPNKVETQNLASLQYDDSVIVEGHRYKQTSDGRVSIITNPCKSHPSS